MGGLGNREIMAKNILRYMRENGKTRQDMCDALGVKYTTFTDWVKGNSYPRIDKIELMANYFGISKADLVEERLPGAVSKPVLRIPVLGSVAGGIPIEMIEDIVDYEELPAEMARGGRSFIGLKIKGDSMEPRIWDGDTVIVELMPQVENGQIAIVTVNGEDAACKRFYRYADRIVLDSLNPKCARREFTAGEAEQKPVRVLGRVVEVRGKIG